MIRPRTKGGKLNIATKSQLNPQLIAKNICIKTKTNERIPTALLGSIKGAKVLGEKTARGPIIKEIHNNIKATNPENWMKKVDGVLTAMKYDNSKIIVIEIHRNNELVFCIDKN